MLEPLLSGITFGLALALMVGPVFFALIQTSLHEGFRAGLFFAFGVFVSDASLIALGYLFAGQLDLLNTHRDIMGWVGGSVLIIFGVVQMTRQPKAKEVDDDRRTVHGHYLVRGFLMNTLNPMVLLFWLSVIGIVSLREQYSLSDRFTFFGSVLGTVLSTDLLKSYGAGKLKRLLNAQVMKWINRITGLIVAGFGVEMFVRAFLQS